MRRLVPLLMAAMLLPTLVRAQAEATLVPSLRIEKLGCKKGVHVMAQEARLSAVLGELGKTLGFAVHFQGDDRVVNVDITQRAPDLVARLMESGSLVTDDEPDPKCPGQVRLTRVWVLPNGEEGPAAPPPPTPMEIYRKAHGLPPEDPSKAPRSH